MEDFPEFPFSVGNTSSNGGVSIVKLVFGGGKGAKPSLPTPPSFGLLGPTRSALSFHNFQTIKSHGTQSCRWLGWGHVEILTCSRKCEQLQISKDFCLLRKLFWSRFVSYQVFG